MFRSVLAPALLCFMTACASATPVAAPSPACLLIEKNRADLTEWRSTGFTTETPDESAIELASCFGDPDPFLRDQIGYEGLTALLRAGDVSEATRRKLIASLTAALAEDDPDGFHAPFAALGLSELARTDRVEAFLTDQERSDLAATTANYLENITDYRTFSDAEGWRHGVAHGADLAMQLSLNPQVPSDALLSLRNAITAQVAPASGPAYTHGEPERLARPILFMAARGEIESDDWQAWFERLSNPAPLESWADAFKSETALKRLHNLKAFAQSLYINASLSSNPNLEPIATGALEMLRTLP